MKSTKSLQFRIGKHRVKITFVHILVLLVVLYIGLSMCKSREQWWFGGGDDENTSDDSNTSSSFDSNTNTSSSSNTGGSDTGMVGFTGGTSGDLNPVGDYQQIVDNGLLEYGIQPSTANENSLYEILPSDFSKEPNMYYIGDDLDMTTNDTLIQAYSDNNNTGNMSAFTTNKHLLPLNCLFACNMVPECGAVVARQMNDEEGNGFTKCWFKNNLTTSAQQASPSDQVGTFIKKNPGSVRLPVF